MVVKLLQLWERVVCEKVEGELQILIHRLLLTRSCGATKTECISADANTM